MNTAELIYQHAKRLPEFQVREVLDFIPSYQRSTRHGGSRALRCTRKYLASL